MTLTLTNDYKRTLAVIGRFNTDPDTDLLVFDSSDPDTANLSAADVWEVLAPELGQTPGVDLSCAGYSYMGMSLSRPEAGKRDTARPVPLDSMLLEQASSSSKSKGEIGGELFVALLRDLDVVARFAGHRFPKALLEIARRYLNVDARRLKSGGMIGESQIDWLVANPLFADAIVKVLTSYEADVSMAVRELRRALLEGVLGEGESPLRAKDDVERAEMVDKIVECICKLRFKVLASGSEPDDTSWKAIMGIEPRVPRTQQAMSWVQEMSAGGKFGFDIGEIEGVGVGGTLLDYYNAYMRHSANVHRFVRSPILHSYVFLWLMSKYDESHAGSGKDSATMAYRMGIEGAGINRVRGESLEKVLERRSQLFDGLKASYEEMESTLEPDEKEFVRSLGEYRNLLIEAVFSQVFRDPRRFTREELQEMLENLFANAVDVTAGKLGDILDASIEFGAGFKAPYQGLLGVLESEGTEEEKIEEISKLADGEDDEQRKDVLSKVAESLPKESEDKEHFREEALKAFTCQMGHGVDSKFVGECRASRKELESSTQKNRDLYYLASVLGGRTGEVQGRSAEGVLATMGVDAERVELPKASTEIRKKVELNATSVAQGRASVAVPLSDELKAAVGNAEGGVEIDVRMRSSTAADGGKRDKGKSAGKSVGTVTVTSSDQKIVVDEGIVYELADSEDAPTLEWEPKTGSATESDGSKDKGATNATEKVAISDANMKDALGEVERILADGKKRYARAKRMGDRVGELSSYAELREGLRKISAGVASVDLDETVRADVERKLYTLSFGEIVGAAPDNQSFLGKQDISQTLALMMELVKELGNRQNANLAKDERDELTDEALGPREKGGPPPRLNLSCFFKVPDDEAEGVAVLKNAMDYHGRLCESVSEVVQQLQDMNDLRAIADGMPSGSRLVVVNRTLDEYANAVNKDSPKWHFSLGCHPSVVYFPNCADIHLTADTLQQRRGKNAWEVLKDMYLQW